MARVPISQGNRVQTRPEPRERFQYSAPRNLVGPAMQDFGQAIGKAAQGFDQIQATYDEADALRIENEYRTYERERLRTGENAYLATKGFAAGEGMEPTVSDIRKGAENLLTGARSSRAKEMARRALEQRIGAAEETVARHSVAEMTTARVGQSEARVAGAKQDAAEAYGTKQFAVHLGLIELETRELGRLKGLGADQVREAIEADVSAVHRAVGERMLVDDDVDGAAEHIELFKGAMRFDDEMALRRAIKPKIEFRQAEDDAGLVLGLLDDDSVPAPKDEEGKVVASPGLSTQLQAIESNESGGRQFDGKGKPLRSSAGATGVMQVMPATGPEAAKLAGMRWDPARFNGDENYNRALGQAYYREMLRKFDGNAEYAAAAYNAGPGRVQKVLRDHGPEWESHLPAETRKYVQNFRRKTGIAAGTVSAEMRNAGGKVDATQAYQRLDEIAEAQGWTPERAERARERVAVRIGRDDALKGREEAVQWDAVLTQVDSLGDGFTDVAKINGFTSLPADRRLQLRNMADANRKAVAGDGVKANGDIAVSLGVMAIEEPEKFATQVDLREYRAMLTPGEFASLRLKQSKITKAPQQEVSLRGGISSTIGTYATDDLQLSGDKNKENRLRAMDAMESYLRSHIRDVAEGKRAPTDAEYRQAFGWATQEVVVGKGVLWGEKKGRRFEKDYYDVPRDERIHIVNEWRRIYGRVPSPEEVAEFYKKRKD